MLDGAIARGSPTSAVKEITELQNNKIIKLGKTYKLFSLLLNAGILFLGEGSIL